MKAYIINTLERTITETEYTGSLQEIYKAIEADCFDSVRLPNRDYIFVSDTGLLDDTSTRLGMFEVEGYPQPLAGHGYVIGCDRYGENAPVKTSLEDMRKIITFLSADEARKKFC